MVSFDLFPIWVQCLGDAEAHVLLGFVLRISERVTSLPPGSMEDICAAFVRLAVIMEGGDECTDESYESVKQAMPLIERLQVACHASFRALGVSVASADVLKVQAQVMAQLEAAPAGERLLWP